MNPKLPEVKQLFDTYGISNQALCDLLQLSRASISLKFNPDARQEFTAPQAEEIAAFLKRLKSDIDTTLVALKK